MHEMNPSPVSDWLDQCLLRSGGGAGSVHSVCVQLKKKNRMAAVSHRNLRHKVETTEEEDSLPLLMEKRLKSVYKLSES